MSEVSYPSWFYKKGEAARIFHSPAEHKAAGKGWQDTPADVETPKPVLDAAVDKIRKEAEEETRKAEEAARKIGEQPPPQAAAPRLASPTSSPTDAQSVEADHILAEAHADAHAEVEEVRRELADRDAEIKAKQDKTVAKATAKAEKDEAAAAKKAEKDAAKKSRSKGKK